MFVVHAAITNAHDDATQREPHRRAHLEHLISLRQEGTLIGGGPAPGGRTADLFLRIQRPDQIAQLIGSDPYHRAQVWTGYTARTFAQFVEPWELPPVVADGSRQVMLVEGPVIDPDMAQFALIELRGAGRLAFGGSFSDGQTLSLVRTIDAAEARRWFADTGCWVPERLTARPLIHVL